jgi:predicted O-methyltransferase YrrM
MDAKVTAVLDAYHERMKKEHETMFRGPPPAGSTPPRGVDFRDQVLLAVGPAAGELINILASSLKAPKILEIGTSFGYSGIWLAEAARKSGGHVTTLELVENKSKYAHEMAVKAGLADYIDFKNGDAIELINEMKGPFDFVLLDLWKDLYTPCLEAFYPKLNRGAIIVADNMIAPGGPEVAKYGKAVRAKPKMTSVLVPVGQGLEISVYEG